MSATKRPWRENIEALTMAIVVALLFKYFVLEISKIPSGSMQPTLMGNPETGVFDRTVVDKLSFRVRDPKRFEIVVFKHPLERSRIMVKRLVGMPDEHLRIEHGDLWTRASEAEDWRILRRPPAVQREMWRELRRGARAADWSVVLAGKEWRAAGDSLVARGDGRARWRPDVGPIRDGYLDGYPAALIDELGSPDGGAGRQAVGDVRLEGEIVALAGTSAVTFELTEGRRVYEFTLPGPAAPAEAEATVLVRDSATSSERLERGERARLAAGERVSFAVENLDDRLALELDGRTVLAVEIEHSARQEASLTIGVAGEGADLEGLTVYRDVYYLSPEGRERWQVAIPAGHYVMLGDNTQDSADSRLWEAQTLTWSEGGEPGAAREARVNFRARENPVRAPLPDGGRGVRYRDVWGEVGWYAEADEVRGPSLPANQPLVPRELVLGRAFAVFWPIRPFQGLWRLGWLR